MWDFIVLLSTVLVAVVMPLELVFGMASSNWLIPASAVVSAIFTVDIALRLADGQNRMRYLRTWFTVDLLAAMPFDLVAVMIDGGGGADVFRALALLRVLRVARILALQREWRVRTSMNPAVLRLSFFGFWIALVSHWIACGWIGLDGPDFAHPEISPYQQALYWTITTLTTVGYGDIVPRGSGPIAYTMVVMALGAAMYGYIIGNVASLLANIDVLRSRHLTRMETIGNFMRDRQVPRHLQAQVRDYYNYLWDSRAGQQSEMLSDLPAPLRTEIALHLNRNVLRKVPLFSGASEVFLRELVLHFESVVAIPGEAIVRRGEIGHRIYFISRGTVEVLSLDESEVVATLRDGDFFGEGALLTSQPRSNTVRAVDYCNLFALNREHFNQVLEEFPEFAEKVRRVSEARQTSAGD